MKISGVIFDIEDDQKRLQEIEQQIAKEGFWDNPEENKSILKKRSSLSNRIERYNKLANDLEENQILLDLAVEESDEETLAEVSQQISDLDQRIGNLSLELMLAGEDDGKNAIVERSDWSEEETSQMSDLHDPS